MAGMAGIAGCKLATLLDKYYRSWANLPSCHTCHTCHTCHRVVTSPLIFFCWQVQTCTSCPAGTYNPVKGAGATTLCLLCPSGTYSTSIGLTNLSGCVNCPSGYFSSNGSTECGRCPANTFSDPTDENGCISCPPSSSSPSGSSMNGCTCNTGYYQFYRTRATGGLESYVMDRQARTLKIHVFTTGGNTVIDFLRATLVNVSCDNIFLNHTMVQEGLLDVTIFGCNTEVKLSYIVNGAFAASESTAYFECTACPSGTYSSLSGQDECTSCLAGTYQSQPGSSVCVACTPGTISSSTGAGACTGCHPGTYETSNQCVACNAGYFSSDSSQTVCQACTNNTWASPGSSGCSACPLFSSNNNTPTDWIGCSCENGMFMNSTSIRCQECHAGEWSISSATVCSKCNIGTFSNSTRVSSCTACSSGTFSVSLGQTKCTVCNAGEIISSSTLGCISCPLTYYCPSDGNMYECPLGTYVNQSGLSSITQCQLCPVNFFCVDQITMELCPLHTHSNPGASSKLSCICDSGYTCTYKKSLKAIVTLPMTQTQFLMVQDQFIQAVADAAGVSVDKVTIISITPETTQNRRLLKGKTISVKVNIQGSHGIHQIETHLKRKGLPDPVTRIRVQHDHHVHTSLK